MIPYTRRFSVDRLTTRSAIVLCLALVVGASPASAAQDPRDLVDTTIETLRENVQRDAALLETDPAHALSLVERVVAPHIDVRLASRLVLGKHWVTATDLQRDAFVDGLRGLLMRIFAIHLRDYGTAEVAFSPTVLHGGDKRRAVVRTEVARAGIPPTNVDYRLHHTDGRWLIYDVSIFGISMVKTYRLTINGELERNGIDGLIQQINALHPVNDALSLRQPVVESNL